MNLDNLKLFFTRKKYCMTHQMNIMTLHVLGKIPFIQNILANRNIVKIRNRRVLLIKMGRFSVKISNYILNRSFLMKMNIEEIKFKKIKLRLCVALFFPSSFYIFSTRIGEYRKISMLKNTATMLFLKKNQ